MYSEEVRAWAEKIVDAVLDQFDAGPMFDRAAAAGVDTDELRRLVDVVVSAVRHTGQ